MHDSYATSFIIAQEFGNLLSDPNGSRRLIGRLVYLTYSRPEISYVVSKLNQFLSAPIDEHMLACFKILKHLKCGPGNGMYFISLSALILKGFSEFGWGASIH